MLIRNHTRVSERCFGYYLTIFVPGKSQKMMIEIAKENIRFGRPELAY